MPRYSHTMPSPSASLMYRYAGCERGTGAMPCRRASLQVILPFRLSSYRASASSSVAAPRAGTLAGADGTGHTTGLSAVLSHPAKLREDDRQALGDNRSLAYAPSHAFEATRLGHGQPTGGRA